MGKTENPAMVDEPFLMPIQDVFSIEGRGTVVIGRIERGKIKVGEEVEIVGARGTRKTVITAIEMITHSNRELASGNVGLLLKDMDQNEIERGMVVAKPGSVTRDGNGTLAW